LADGTFTAVVAPTDGSSTGRFIGPNPLMPPTGDLGLHLTFAPDGAALIAQYDDAATNTTAAWWLPVDGSAGHVIDQGSFEGVDVQRLPPPARRSRTPPHPPRPPPRRGPGTPTGPGRPSWPAGPRLECGHGPACDPHPRRWDRAGAGGGH